MSRRAVYPTGGSFSNTLSAPLSQEELRSALEDAIREMRETPPSLPPASRRILPPDLYRSVVAEAEAAFPDGVPPHLDLYHWYITRSLGE